MSCIGIALEASQKFGSSLRIVTGTDPAYDASRAISNSRFDYRPCAIAYCATEDHIAFCLQYCTVNNQPFRVRSGGHQHEGMCSGDDVLIIDLSLFNADIDFLQGNQAWIQPGMQLGDGKTPGTVYFEVAQKNLVIPGGGCESVRIGGLVQGGGWGPSARMYGLTCDSLVAVRIVLSSGQAIETRFDNAYLDLFWALRGGGGGNFGVVTKYLFQLYPAGARTQFTVTWARPALAQVTETWMSLFSGQYQGLPPQYYKPGTKELVPNITSGLRLSVVGDDLKAAVALGGLFYGTEADARAILKPLLDITPLSATFTVTPAPPQSGAGSVMDPHILFGQAMQAPPPAAPAQTCDNVPHPHKISSCFPVTGLNWANLSTAIINYLAAAPDPGTTAVNRYINLMSMGGQVSSVPKDLTPFPYRDKPFMMQMQAWWSDPADTGSDSYVQWIAGFRPALVVSGNGGDTPLAEGAFINFPDKGIGNIDITTAAGKRELLGHYYGGFLQQLIYTKTKYDPTGIFLFPMSIPGMPPVAFAAAADNTIAGDSVLLFQTSPAGVLSFNTFNDGGWASPGSIPLPNNGAAPVIAQIASYPGPSTVQDIFLLDEAGKMWRYQSSAPAIASLDWAFSSAPQPGYHLSSFCCAPVTNQALHCFMATTEGKIWQSFYQPPFGNKGWTGTYLVSHNIPAPVLSMSCAADPPGSYSHVLAVDATDILWYNLVDETGYSWWAEKTFLSVIAETAKNFPNGVPVQAIRCASCAVDAQSTAHIFVTDAIGNDLWYLRHRINGPWDFNFVNIQDQIIKNNPGVQRKPGFVSLSATFNTQSNEPHVVVSDAANSMYHTYLSAFGWDLLRYVPG